jgi:hypothetical protein
MGKKAGKRAQRAAAEGASKGRTRPLPEATAAGRSPNTTQVQHARMPPDQGLSFKVGKTRREGTGAVRTMTNKARRAALTAAIEAAAAIDSAAAPSPAPESIMHAAGEDEQATLSRSTELPTPHTEEVTEAEARIPPAPASKKRARSEPLTTVAMPAAAHEARQAPAALARKTKKKRQSFAVPVVTSVHSGSGGADGNARIESDGTVAGATSSEVAATGGGADAPTMEAPTALSRDTTAGRVTEAGGAGAAARVETDDADGADDSSSDSLSDSDDESDGSSSLALSSDDDESIELSRSDSDAADAYEADPRDAAYDHAADVSDSSEILSQSDDDDDDIPGLVVPDGPQTLTEARADAGVLIANAALLADQTPENEQISAHADSNAGDDSGDDAGGDADAGEADVATDGATTDSAAGFRDADANNDRLRDAVVEKIFDWIPYEWRSRLMLGNRLTSRIPEAEREEHIRKKLLRSSYAQVLKMWNAMEHHMHFCSEKKIAMVPVEDDVLAMALEVYAEDARARAEERRERAAQKGDPPRRNDRGGDCATKPILEGYRLWNVVGGLGFIEHDTDFVKDVARVGAGMPQVMEMWNLGAIDAFEDCSNDVDASEFERAYAGGGYLMCAASTRSIDMQRTGKIEFEAVPITDNHKVLVATGIASRSKAKSRYKMQPLAWRAPVVRVGKGDTVDLQPLIGVMATQPEEKGGVFRDYVPRTGCPKKLRFAAKWTNGVASGETIEEGLQHIARRKLTVAQAARMRRHGARHVVPELSRSMKIGAGRRQALGYWRGEKAIAESADDRVAFRRAIKLARETATKNEKRCAMANRYSSVFAALTENDDTRTAVLLNARAVYAKTTGEDAEDQVRASTARHSDVTK